MIIDDARLIPFAAALSLEAASAEIVSQRNKGSILNVQLLENYSIQLGGKGLCFRDSELIKAVSTGFGLPNFSPFFRHFNNAFKSISMLLKIKSILSREQTSIEKVSIGLRAGLAATVAFANHDSQSKKLLESEESGIVLFTIPKSDIAMWISFSANELCEVGSGPPKIKPSAIFSFQNLKVASSAISGWFDHLGGPALGEAEISGNIPLLDKIGYISRKVQKEVPSIL
jgi:hypothetical protein